MFKLNLSFAQAGQGSVDLTRSSFSHSMRIIPLIITLFRSSAAVPSQNDRLLTRIEHLEQEILTAEARIFKLLKQKRRDTVIRNNEVRESPFADGDFVPTLPSCEANAETDLEQMWRDGCKIAEVDS